jgi:dTDP-4-amino-4,6-dideoxygalactose transaminase
MGDKEQEYVAEAFATNWIAPIGKNLNLFEEKIAQNLGVNGAVAVTTGTAALHLALQLVGVQSGDVVLCQSFTFAASAFPIMYCNAQPIFVDSETDTWNIDPVLLETAITDQLNKGKKPAAIVVVHLYGMPAQMMAIMQIANKYQIPVIEDAAEALGSTYNGKACGSMGALGILSFNGNKIITTSGGGAVVGNNTALLQQAKHISTQAKEPASFYLHSQVGHNYRMSNVLAGIGCGQMEVLPERIAKRREIFAFYQHALADCTQISFLNEPTGMFCNRWLTTILIKPTRAVVGINEKIRIELENKNIETRLLWKPLHQQPVFKACKSYCNGVSDMLFENGLCLPSGSNLTNENLNQVVYELRKSLNQFC